MNRREKLFLKEKEKFEKEKENLKEPIYHIMANIQDPALVEIDNVYVAADFLSLKNANLHHRIL